VATIRVRACAKVNLFLRVLGRRPDGYHDIETIFQSIALCDELAFAPRTRPGLVLRVELSGARGSLPVGDDNLVQQAARVLLEAHGGPVGASASLLKRIPIGAGLGGGSADAAATLVALNELWGLGLREDELHALAASLGSDVPYCLVGGTAAGRSRGELVTRLDAAPKLWFVLGILDEPLSTAEVYARWRPASPPAASAEKLTAALRTGEVEAIANALHNDLDVAAQSLRPVLAEKKDVLVDAGAAAACVSGSGPTVFGLCKGRDEARRVAARVAGVFDRVDVVGSKNSCVDRIG